MVAHHSCIAAPPIPADIPLTGPGRLQLENHSHRNNPCLSLTPVVSSRNARLKALAQHPAKFWPCAMCPYFQLLFGRYSCDNQRARDNFTLPKADAFSPSFVTFTRPSVALR